MKSNRGTLFFIYIAFFVLSSHAVYAQGAEDKLGTWLFFNNKSRLTEKFTLNTTFQLRDYEFFDNLQQHFALLGLRYEVSRKVHVMLAGNYIETKSFVKGEQERVSHERRLVQQLGVNGSLGRLQLNHRFRIEERWLSAPGSDDFESRYRQWLWLRMPLNHSKMEANTFFLTAYDEIFLNFQDDVFGQNRLFGGFGYQIDKNVRVETGYFKNHFRGRNFDRIIFMLFIQTDLRKIFHQS
ncbi:MAG: DUF2490 domain-containing protein [Flavobacteriaceae bacterium]|nr:DUF2490 domain-containing protein [Flavobacteriaceae bacterium]